MHDTRMMSEYLIFTFKTRIVPEILQEMKTNILVKWNKISILLANC